MFGLSSKSFWQKNKPELTKALDVLQHAENDIKDIPALIGLAKKISQSLITGQHKLHRSGHGEDFWQFRPHDPSDRPQDIDWRQSAKGDQIYIRQKEWQTAQNVLFWCDNNAGMNFMSHQAPYSKATASSLLTLSLSMLLTESGENVKLIAENMRAGRTDQTIQKMANILWNNQESGNKDSLYDLTHHQACSKSTIILIGDFLNDEQELENILSSFVQQNCVGFLIQTLDPAEIDFPYKGRCLFSTPDQNIKLDISQAKSIQQQYKNHIQEHLKRVENTCSHQGWGYHLHNTAYPVQNTLFNIWNDFEARRNNK